jgi:hypothetical protein
MSRRKTRSSNQAFRVGRRSACEAHLFEFELFSTAEGDIEPVRRIAASSSLEAMTFLLKDEPDYRIRSVRDCGVIILLSGSPYS